MDSIKIVDGVVALLILGIAAVGGYSWVRAIGRRGMMSTMPGMDPLRYLFGTLIAVCIVFGVYIVTRDRIARALTTSSSDLTPRTDDTRDESARRSDQDGTSASEQTTVSVDSATSRPSPLQFLPEDERRVLEPILESPGLTQVELRGRSDFSKAKVSQTVSELEDRGLIYREKQGRTYRVYPGEVLKERS